MEIPLMNEITGFEAGIAPLQDPSFFFTPLGEFSEFLKVSSFWTWGAIALATIAAFTSLLHRTKIAFFRIGSGSSAITEPLIQFDEDPDEETCSISSGSDADDSPPTFEASAFVGDEDFRVLGSIESDQDRRGNLNLKGLYENEEDDGWLSGGVVKLWSELGFGFERSSGLISMWDLNRGGGEVLRSFKDRRNQIPATTVITPAVILSAGVVGMSIWDARAGTRTPAAVAEWQPRRRRVLGVGSGEVGKVYARDHAGSVVVRDIRKLASPLKEIATESDEIETWFDSEAVMVGDGEEMGFEGELTENGCGPSVVTRCCKAMKTYLF